MVRWLGGAAAAVVAAGCQLSAKLRHLAHIYTAKETSGERERERLH